MRAECVPASAYDGATVNCPDARPAANETNANDTNAGALSSASWSESESASVAVTVYVLVVPSGTHTAKGVSKTGGSPLRPAAGKPSASVQSLPSFIVLS